MRFTRRTLTPFLLPPSALGALAIFLAWVLPQACLLSINWGAWNLAVGDMNPDEHMYASVIAGTGLLTFTAGIVTAGWLWWTKSRLGRRAGLVPLVLTSTTLATTIAFGERAIPDEVAGWMLPQGEWMLKQFALTMPACLLGALRLVCPDRETAKNDAESVASIGGIVGIAAALAGGSVAMLFFLSMIGAIFSGSSFVAQITWTTAYIGLATLAAAAMLRVCLSLYVWLRAKSPISLAVMTGLIAIAGPIGGLVLNAAIPFPSDFQLPAIYILAAVNGVILMLPSFSHPLAHRAVWLAQCALFPFTAYFFIVFIAFLPLTPLSLLFFGLGLLTYVPSLLFFLHGYKILDGFRAEIRDSGKLMPAALGLIAVLAWPVGYTVQARLDRSSLNGALDYLQYPNYGTNAKYAGNLSNLHSALYHLRDFKKGLYLPFLSEYYNWLAFDNLVLPDERLKSLHKTFFGGEMVEGITRPGMGMFWDEGRGRRQTQEILSGPQGTRPDARATARKIDTTVSTTGDATRLRAKITIENPTSAVTEFGTNITLPPGVLISGMWLQIGTENVPGRIFEKKAALWVYQKITEVRPIPRDPAILRYTGAGQVELRVYPVEPGTPRFVEVEFLYPTELRPGITISSTILNPPQDVEKPKAGAYPASDGRVVLVLPEGESPLPSMQRTPYLHVLADTSKDSRYRDANVLRDTLAKLAGHFAPGMEMRLSFVNFETTAFRKGERLNNVNDLTAEELGKAAGEFRGGFLAGRAIKETLWQARLEMQTADKDDLTKYPQIVILQGSGNDSLPMDGLDEFAMLAPDFPAYWTTNSDQKPVLRALAGGSPSTEPSAVQLLQVGTQRFAVPAGQAVFQISGGSVSEATEEVKAIMPSTGKFVMTTDIQVQPATSQYAAALKPWEIELERIFQPYLKKAESLALVLKLCRETGVLVPSGSYMVVENSAQWKTLEETEKKTLKGHEALAMTESTPEPATYALIGLAALFFAGRHILRSYRGRASC